MENDDVIPRRKPLSNFEIDDILKSISNFRGVFSKDMLPKHMKAESTLQNVVQEVYRESGVRGCVPGGVSQVSGIRWIEQR